MPSRKRAIRRDPSSNPTIPKNTITQTYNTILTLYREISYPQILTINLQGFEWLTPPSLGHIILILIYWVVIILMLTVNTIYDDAYYYERIGFYAAWISVTQVPFIILLSAKVSLVGWLIGSSYERLNWAHRWAGRTLFICATVHGGFFLREWILQDFLSLELKFMPIVKYGMGAWCVLLWTNITSLAPFRRMAYELYLLQHIASAAVLLWLLYIHVSDKARHYIWIAIAFVAFDRLARWVWVVYRNVNIFRGKGVFSKVMDRIGHKALLQAVPGDTTRITIKNVTWKWKPGQHIYLCIPRIGLIEAHQLTISNTVGESIVNDAIFAMRAHSGFSRRLHSFAAKRQASGKPVEVRAIVQGPFGAHPRWNTFDTLILISASTGASFTLPILESVLENACCVQHVAFMLLVRHRPQCSCYLSRLREIAAQASKSGLIVRIRIVVTGKVSELDDASSDIVSPCVCGPSTSSSKCCCGAPEALTEKREFVDEENGDVEASAGCCAVNVVEMPKQQSGNIVESDGEISILKESNVILTKANELASSGPKSVTTPSESFSTLSRSQTEVEFVYGARPDLGEFIRYPVEEATGETCVAVCGGSSLTGHVRNAVAKLSDERAVHKGTGAQGICLHVEQFNF
jgi:NAD(P)H-flavin reductase